MITKKQRGLYMITEAQIRKCYITISNEKGYVESFPLEHPLESKDLFYSVYLVSEEGMSDWVGDYNDLHYAITVKTILQAGIIKIKEVKEALNI